MARRIAAFVVTVAVVVGLTAAPAAAENPFDCEGKIALFCPGPVP